MLTPPPTRYAILGAGRQGTAAAYDLATLGAASAIVLADADAAVAERAAARVNAMTGRAVAVPRGLDVRDEAAVRSVLAEAQVVLSAVPYYFNVALSRACIAAGVHLVDMGGHTGVVREQLALDAEARAAGCVILPDCGMGPGLINVLAVRAMELLDHAREVHVWDCGLPQSPVPPWNYQCAFHINGLTNEYDGTVPLLRDGRHVEIEALSELRLVEVPPHGTFESFIAAGGSTAPWSFEGRLERFETRILRYPGHHAWFRAFKELGLFREDPIDVGGQQVVPRQLYHALLAPHISPPAADPVIRDVCIMHCRGLGERGGAPTTVVLDVLDRYDEATGFTGMERLTGFHCAIMMAFLAAGAMPPGARALEARLLDGTPSAQAVLDEVGRRGISLGTRFEPA